MKRVFALSITILILILLASCNFDNSARVNPYVTISLNSGVAGSRTALPVGFDLAEYEYVLTAKIGSSTDDTTIVEKTGYDTFKNGKDILLEAKSYVFTLSGYIKDTETIAIQGVSSTIDLSSGGGKTVTFFMKPVTGLTGKAEISVTYPSSVQSVECYATSDLFGNTIVSSVTVTPDDASAPSKFTLTDVPTGTNCFAVIYFFDENGVKIASRVESLLVISGLTSESTIVITEDMLHTYDVNMKFTKDAGEYDLFGNDVVLVDADGHEYVLELSNGVFKGTAAEGEYTVFIKNKGTGVKTDTGITFSSADESAEYNLKTVQMPIPDGLKFTEATPFRGGLKGDAEGEYLIPEDSDGIKFTVEINDGYEQITGEDLKVNGVVVADIDEEAAGDQILITSDGGTVSTSGTKPIDYHITYVFETEASWASGYSAPVAYTVDNYSTVTLPGKDDIVLEDKELDGWRDATGALFARIPAGKTGDLTLTAVWKQPLTTNEKPTSADDNIWTDDEIANTDIKGKILTSGYSLIVKWADDASGKTEVYYDYNSDGVINGDDKLVSNEDFTGYVLEARNEDGTAPASDFTFTVLGGNLAGIKGSGKNSYNTSIINISGEDTVIGNDKDTGVFLDTLSDERININGQLSGNYSLTMISANKYEKGHDYYEVARIGNSSYAQMSHLNCLYWETDVEALKKDDETNLTPRYVSQALNIIDYKGEKVVYLASTDPIDLPVIGEVTPGVNVNNGIIWVETENPETGGVDTSLTDFALGTTATIRVPCSVLSINVKNGSFYLTQDSLKTSSGEVVLTDNLGQKSASTYDTTLQTGETHPYTYLHMFSTRNQITPAIATEFLRTVIFQKTDKDTEIEITVNLETIPYQEIVDFATSKGTTIDKFKYYDGSFYLEQQFPNNGSSYTEYYSWERAYDEAKKTIFNGLNGYLMTITSEVENGYVFNQLGAERAWTGGSSLKPQGNYDSLNFTANGTNDGYYWMCGPEAGQKFYKAASSNRTNVVEGMFQNFMSGEPNNYLDMEPCIQFYKNAEWNNMPHYCGADTEQWGFTPHSYVVEFRPYKNQWTTQKANYQSVSMTSSY